MATTSPIRRNPGRGKWFALSRPFFMGLAVGGMLGAVLVGVIARRVPGQTQSATSEPVVLKQSTGSSAFIALANASSTPAPQPGEQAGAIGAAAAPDSSRQEGVAMAPPPDADTQDLGQAAEPAALVAKVAPAHPSLAVAVAAQPADDDAQRACSKAIADKQRNRILTTCEAALAANPRAVEFAVALAKTEFDRGKIARHSSGARRPSAPIQMSPIPMCSSARQNKTQGTSGRPKTPISTTCVWPRVVAMRQICAPFSDRFDWHRGWRDNPPRRARQNVLGVVSNGSSNRSNSQECRATQCCRGICESGTPDAQHARDGRQRKSSPHEASDHILRRTGHSRWESKR